MFHRYLHQDGSREMAVWRAKVRGPLAVTRHRRTEIVNAICRAAFLGQLTPVTPADFAAEFAAGHLRQAEILWRSALNRAAVLSQQHTPRLGTHSLEVLHVACALELKSRHFLTFDLRQQQLANAAGLRLVRLDLGA